MDTEYLLFIVMIYLAITLYFIVILYARCKVIIIINLYLFDSKNNSFSSSKSIFTKNVNQMLREEASNMS